MPEQERQRRQCRALQSRLPAVSEGVFSRSVVPGAGLDAALMDDRRIRVMGHVLVGLQGSFPPTPRTLSCFLECLYFTVLIRSAWEGSLNLLVVPATRPPAAGGKWGACSNDRRRSWAGRHKGCSPGAQGILGWRASGREGALQSSAVGLACVPHPTPTPTPGRQGQGPGRNAPERTSPGSTANAPWDLGKSPSCVWASVSHTVQGKGWTN